MCKLAVGLFKAIYNDNFMFSFEKILFLSFIALVYWRWDCRH